MEEADRRTLARRVSFDLTGLPPRAEDAEAFARDRRPDAYERFLDSVLESPHYGERMAVHWLDLVRYADTTGYHGDIPVNVYPFRDYVVRSFNENTPFDVMTREHLAGDLLADPTETQLVASAYNRLSRMTNEGGAQAKEYLRQVRHRQGAQRLDGVAGLDAGMRRVPRPQVRPLPGQGLLFDGGILRRHRGEGGIRRQRRLGSERPGPRRTGPDRRETASTAGSPSCAGSAGRSSPPVRRRSTSWLRTCARTCSPGGLSIRTRSGPTAATRTSASADGTGSKSSRTPSSASPLPGTESRARRSTRSRLPLVTGP